MNNRKRYLKTPVLCIVLCLLIAGVSSVSLANEPTRVWFLTWLWSDELNELAARYQAETGKTLEVEWVDPDVLTEKLTLAVASGVAPDVVQVTTASVYGADGLLLPLEPYLERSGLVWDDFFGAPKEWSFDQRSATIYGIPFVTDARILAWNKQLFREVGLADNTPPEYWDELLDYSRRLVRLDGENRLQQAGFEFSGEGQWFPIYLGTAGGEMWDYTTEIPRALPDIDAAITALRFGLDVVNLHGGWAAYSEYVQGAPEQRFATQTGMMVFGSPIGRAFATTFPDLEVGYSWVPIERENGKRYSLSGGYQYAIPRDARNPEQGWQFIEWFIDPDRLATYASSTGWIPASYSAVQSYVVPEWMDPIILTIAPLGRAWPSSYGAEYEYQTAFFEVMSGESPPETAATTLQESLQVAAQRQYGER